MSAELACAADLADLEGNARLPVRSGWYIAVAKRSAHACRACAATIGLYEPHATAYYGARRARVRVYMCLKCVREHGIDARPLVDRRALQAAGKILGSCASISELSPAAVAFVGSLLARASGVPF